MTEPFNDLASLPNDARINILVIAYENAPGVPEAVAQGLLPLDQLRFIIVVAKNVPAAASVYVAEAFRNCPDKVLNAMFSPEIPDGLDFIVAGLEVNQFNQLVAQMQPRNAAAEQAQAERGEVFDPTADA